MTLLILLDPDTRAVLCFVGLMLAAVGLYHTYRALDEAISCAGVRAYLTRESVLSVLQYKYRYGAASRSELLQDLRDTAIPGPPVSIAAMVFQRDWDTYAPRIIDNTLAALEREGRIIGWYGMPDPKKSGGKPVHLVRLVGPAVPVRPTPSARTSHFSQVRGEVIEITDEGRASQP